MPDITKRPHERSIPPSEIRIEGHPVSRGIAIGKIICLFGSSRQYYKTQIDKGAVDREIARFRAAHSRVEKQLRRLSSPNLTSATSASIFDVHLAMLQDSSLVQKVENTISDLAINAEWAVKTVTDEYVARYRAITDEYFRERYIDIEDISEQLMSALGGRRHPIRLAYDAVIAARELRPSTLAELSREKPRGLISETGGWTSHTFILARELELPSITGVKKLMRRVKTGDPVIVDGYSGTVVLHPSAESIKYYSSKTDLSPVKYSIPDEPTTKPIKTADGHIVTIRANFDIPESFKRAKRLGARGIGLYRSEYLFNRFNGFPTEAQQVKAYSEIAEYAGEERARIRTFDMGVDQLLDHAYRREKNPALGLRGIRLGLSMQRHLRTQLRAILQASLSNNIDVILPMVSGIEEVRQVRDMITREKQSLASKGILTGEPRLGIMVEVPAAVINIDVILNEVDCLCLGTNDLVQYLLAVDRDNESVSDLFRSLHPAVIRSLKRVFESASAAGKPVVVCGEVAGSPFYVPILLGLGATELSMNVNSIVRVRKIISGITFSDCRNLADRVLTCASADEVEHITEGFINDRWVHLFPTDFFNVRKS